MRPPWKWFRKGHEIEKAAAGEAEKKPLQPNTNNGASGYEPKLANEMRKALQKELKRPVILSREGQFHGVVRKGLKYRRLLLGLGVVGVGMAGVATAGVASTILVIAAAGLHAVGDVPALLDSEILDQKPVVLLQDAVPKLLPMTAADRARAVRAALKTAKNISPDGTVTLSAADIDESAPETPPVPQTHIGPVQISLRTGFMVMGAGALLLALTLIQRDVPGLMAKVASAMLVIGALIAGAAVVNSNWLKSVDRAMRDGRPSHG